jgi:hypothetical protein
MGGGFPLGLELCNGKALVDTTISNGVLVNPSASANTKGAFTQLIASTAADACWMVVQVQNVISRYAVDIAVGAAASEVVIANNLFSQSGGTTRNVSHYIFPCAIPAGTRVSARSQTQTASDSNHFWCGVALFDGSFTQIEGAAGVDALGFAAGSTGLTTVTSNASANTKGTYSQLIASTAVDYMGLILALDNQNGSGVTSASYLIDIAVGAGGAEQVIVPNIVLNYALTATVFFPGSAGPYFVPIPAGTRVAVRCQDNVGGLLINLGTYGIYQ